ncbi:NAD-dependent epimerase/dehydratase family protein [Nonomuraea glycinis]|uniref:NAD-dependent epimerase/dehydratase family protein n=1 Tax=Nonomuraea glycinis TaxID=2047744 RepID=UPI0033BD44DF
MRLLILGGGHFLGRTIAAQALARGHQVTVFNRGKSSTDLPGVTVVRGDRSVPADLVNLAARGDWDAVVDTSGMTTDLVELSTGALAGIVDHYVFISTVNVYQGWPVEPLTDDSPVRSYAPYGPPGESSADEYGRLKAGCEQAVTTAFAGRSALLRPGVILGPHENVGRLPWWLTRIREGGRVLAPGRPDWPIQPVDVRDVAAFALDVAEQRLPGSYNVTAPIGHSTFEELLDACRTAVDSVADLVWVDDAFLRRHRVPEWVGLPLWRDYSGTWHVDAARARAAGLTCRPLPDTVTDTWQWMRDTTLAETERSAELGITRRREQEILAAWDAARI